MFWDQPARVIELFIKPISPLRLHPDFEEMYIRVMLRYCLKKGRTKMQNMYRKCEKRRQRINAWQKISDRVFILCGPTYQGGRVMLWNSFNAQGWDVIGRLPVNRYNQAVLVIFGNNRERPSAFVYTMFRVIMMQATATTISKKCRWAIWWRFKQFCCMSRFHKQPLAPIQWLPIPQIANTMICYILSKNSRH